METPAEENYLKIIYSISEDTNEAVSTQVIAEQVNSKPSSVTDMIQRLSAKKLVNYKKYQGVSLSSTGKKKALKIIRKHRLWECFLVEYLNLSWNEVHEIAEQLEHIHSPLLVSRLDEFMKFPARDPHGDIIPDEKGNIRPDNNLMLSEVKVGQVCTVSRIKDSSSDFLVYLDSLKIGLRTSIKVLELIPYDNSVKAQIAGKEIISLSEKVCNNLYVLINKKK